MGQKIALVDKTPGLTRDRREGVILGDGIFDIPIRLVDTAGFEGTRDLDDKKLSRRNLNKLLIEDMLRQTRNALIYSDLALFVLDSREGITYNDVALYNWLTLNQMRIQSDQKKINNLEKMRQAREGPSMEDFEEEVLIPDIVTEARAFQEENMDPLEKQQAKDKIDRANKKRIRDEKLEKMASDFQKQFVNLDEIFINQEVKVPKILYLANKAEDGNEGDILGDFYMKFPYAAEDESCEPIFISAEHGDGFTDLYAAIQNEIPDNLSGEYVDRKKKRLQRYNDLKESMMDDIVDLKLDLIQKQGDSENK